MLKRSLSHCGHTVPAMEQMTFFLFGELFLPEHEFLQMRNLYMIRHCVKPLKRRVVYGIVLSAKLQSENKSLPLLIVRHLSLRLWCLLQVNLDRQQVDSNSCRSDQILVRVEPRTFSLRHSWLAI